MESWRVKVVSTFDLTPPRAKVLPLRPPFFCGGGLAALLDGDLRDEVPHLLDRRLRLFLAGGLDDVLDLLTGLVHRLEIITGHGCCSFLQSRKRLESVRHAKPQAVCLALIPSLNP